MLDALLRLLVPPRCLACGSAAVDAVCAACRAALPWLRDVCARCALPRPCAPCPARRQAFAGAWAPVAYEGVARDLVHALKFDAHLAAADVMSAQMAAGVAQMAAGVAQMAAGVARLEAAGAAAAPLVPVPFAPGRRRRRGFDPADLLARRLAARTGRPVLRCLRRGAGAGRQLGAPRAVRLRTGGIELDGRAGAAERAPPAAILVDDVHTTGATLDACARALSGAGIRPVFAVTYARTVRRA